MGCVCANGTILDDNGNCVTPTACQCIHEGRTLRAGEKIMMTDKCQECTCENGCVTCKSIPCVENCTFSDWSAFGACSAQCNGTQNRYKTLQGTNCSRHETEVETRPCSSTTQIYEKGCSTCTCYNNTEEICRLNCAVNNETCSQIQDPLFTYVYEPSKNGSCCGTCVKVPKSDICEAVRMPDDYVKYENCTSLDVVTRYMCAGGCQSYAMSGLVSITSGCRCCAPVKTSPITITMNCTDATGHVTQTTMPYYQIMSCSCTACGIANS